MKTQYLKSLFTAFLCTSCAVSSPSQSTPTFEEILLILLFFGLLGLMLLGGVIIVDLLFFGGKIYKFVIRKIFPVEYKPQTKQAIVTPSPVNLILPTEKPVSKLDKILAEKKEKLLGIPTVSFHFVDKEQIKSFYNDFFKEPTIESLVSEITGEISGQIKGNVPQVVEAKIGGKDLSKWIRTVKIPDISLSGMFVRYQRETIKSGQVTLGLEEIDIELNELQAFDESIEELTHKFAFVINENALQEKRSQLKEKAAERTMKKLEQASGWVLVEGRFKIERKDEFYSLTYFHPVNEFLTNQATKVTISISIPIVSIEEQFTGNYSQSVGGIIPVRIYGQVWQPIDRNANVWNLQLTPLAVY